MLSTILFGILALMRSDSDATMLFNIVLLTIINNVAPALKFSLTQCKDWSEDRIKIYLLLPVGKIMNYMFGLLTHKNT